MFPTNGTRTTKISCAFRFFRKEVEEFLAKRRIFVPVLVKLCLSNLHFTR